MIFQGFLWYDAHMMEKVLGFMEEQNMIEPGDRVAAGVSGGADSVCLLFLLLEYQKRIPFHLAVVHVNHGIRKEAAQDAAYVEKLCEKHQLPFFLYERNVPQIAADRKLSCEEAGRQVRYEAFREVLKQWKPKEKLPCEDAAGTVPGEGKIAVAHHLQDSAETLLFNLFRGTGVWGLTGIRPVREGIIRPLLILRREEIEAYLRQNRISWCIDPTNEEDTYTRNKIRKRILPYVENEIVNGATEHIGATAREMAELTDYLKEEICKASSLCLRDEGEKGVILRLEDLQQLSSYLQKQVILSALQLAGGTRRNIGRVHIEALLKLMQKNGYKQQYLPGGIIASKEYGILRLQRKGNPGEIFCQSPEISVQIPGTYSLNDESFFEFSLIKKEKIDRIEENQYTKYLDYDKINNCLTLRFRRQGDFLTINEAGQKKSLKEYMIQEKIPAPLRDRLPVIADGSHILWIPGYRISAYYKTDEYTTTCVQMKVLKQQKEEGMAEKIRVMLTEEEVDKRINAMGEEISRDYAGKKIHLICVLKGGVFFMCELAKRISVPVSMDFMAISSYGSKTESSGIIKIIKDLDESITGEDVLVVEDIVDSGRTLNYLLEMLKDRKPNSLRLCTLLDKPDRRVVDVNVDYTGFQIPDEFVVGYGLDYAQKYRNLPYIGVVELDEE